MKSLEQQIILLKGLVGTKDISDWESSFIVSISEQVAREKGTTGLSSKQLEKMLDIFGKHFE